MNLAGPNYDNFRAETLDAPNIPAAGIFIVRHEGRIVDLTTLTLLSCCIGITGTTGVLAAHRSHGVTTLIELTSLYYLKEQDLREASTDNDAPDPPTLTAPGAFFVLPIQARSSISPKNSRKKR